MKRMYYDEIEELPSKDLRKALVALLDALGMKLEREWMHHKDEPAYFVSKVGVE